MKSYEVLARRYCALLGEDPDQVIEGVPVWRIALVDLEAAITALDTFGVDARGPMCEDEYHKIPDDTDPNDTTNKVVPLRRVA